LPSFSRFKESHYSKVTSGITTLLLKIKTQQNKSSTQTPWKTRTSQHYSCTVTVAQKICQKTSKIHLKRAWYTYNKQSKPTMDIDLFSAINKP
jgi:alkylated DNA repair dioxygenase AlkB